ncbi:RNA polymerase sigma factor RpoD [Desulfurella amilsii]|uniref:RNA polymerase sigma factor RpoD n=1 Tax=Desulfurella amilsii TaxID=1562698 RepID=A0A1X4XZ24_9BACT|nr:sigma-70 family RNA polymerase sigma factor [Desulfurella amilsii]OSS42716.1 RNA polymerase sigma factor for flagellar operon [Desulfurella amilsii]OSS42792.1 RNA polymerase sigma factor RpoD [Desulfurella amilsii]
MNSNKPYFNEEQIEYFYPIVKRMVRKIVVKMPESYDEEDFVQIGMMGLLKAIDNIDITKDENAFYKYALLKVRGAILDKLRSVDLVSRYTRDKLKSISKAHKDFLKENIFDASEKSVAKKAGISMKEYYKAMFELSNLDIVSLDNIIEDEISLQESIEDKNIKSAIEVIEKNERLGILKKALSKLTKIELDVLSMYYYEDFSVKEIARIIKKTQSRVSQIKINAIIKLKHLIEQEYINRKIN